MSEQVRRYSVDCPLAYPPLDGERKVVLATDYDALHAEAEALRGLTPELPPRPPEGAGLPRYGLRWNGPSQPLSVPMDDGYWTPWHLAEALRAENEQLRDSTKRIDAYWQSELRDCRNERDLLTAELEALRAESQHWKNMHARSMAMRMSVEFERDEMRAELEEARVLLRHASSAMAREGMESALVYEIDTFLTATPAQEVPDHIEQHLKIVEQGERQEPFVWMRPDGDGFFELTSEGDYLSFPLYRAPQPGPDVRLLAASLYQACGAYDMPERILDALSAAANGEPFAHMIDGLLPCVPPSEQDVRALVEALEECAAALAWNCFGECRAVHAGPIMPAAMALDTARAALAAHRQAQSQA